MCFCSFAACSSCCVISFICLYVYSYVDELNGVVLCYHDMQLLENKGAILFERPFIHFKVQVKFVVMELRVG